MKTRQQLIDHAIEYLKMDFQEDDYTILDALLAFIPTDKLIASLPEKEWKAYETVKEPKKECTYVLFGQMAVSDFNEYGAKKFIRMVKDGKSEACVVAFQDNTPIAEILETANGWHDYAFIDKTVYNKLSKL
jgi:hypothetical protein